MRRLGKNRLWAFILTLGVLLGSSAVFSPPSYGGGNDDAIVVPGDPDGAIGPSKGKPDGNRLSPSGNGYRAASVGDGGKSWRVWSWQFHAVLRSLISRYYRF